MVARKIDLEEKRVYAPNPMTQEPFFALPAVPAQTIPEVVVQEPAVTPPVTTMGEGSGPVHQEPPEPNAEHEREPQQPHIENVPEVEARNETETEELRRSKRARRPAIYKEIYKVYNTEIAYIEGDPTLYEEAMRSPHSLKWLEAIEDEMKSMSSNNV